MAVEQATGQGRALSLPVTVGAMAMMLLIGIVTGGLGAALPLLRPMLGAPPGSGSLVSLYSAGGLAAVIGLRAIGSGVIGPRRGRAGMAVLVGCFSAGCAGMGLAQTWYLLNAVAIVAGLGFGGLIVYLNAAFAVGFGRHSAAMVGLINAAFSLGTIAGPLAIGQLSAHGVQSGLLLIGLLTLVTFPACACGAVPVGGHGAGGSPRALAPLIAVVFLYEALETGSGAWIATHLTGEGMSAATAARLTTAFWAALFAGRLVLPPLTPRLGPRRLVTGCLAVACVAFALACLWPVAPVAYAVAGFAIAPVFPALLIWGASLASSAHESTSVIMIAAMAGNSVFPAAIGLVSGGGTAGIPATIAVAALFCLVAVQVAARLGR